MKTYEVLYLKSRGVASFTEKIEADSAESAYAIAIKEPKCPDCAIISVRDDVLFANENKEFDNPAYSGVIDTVAWKESRSDTSSAPALRGQKLADIFSPVNKLFGSSTASIKQSLTSIQLPKIEFQDSGWILLCRIAGRLCVVVGIFVLIGGLFSDVRNSSEEGFVFFCCALLAASANFFAAHILRLQEKTAAFTEVTAGIMEKHHELMVENVNLLRSIAQKTEDKSQ